MADLVSPTIELVRACVNMYTDFRAFKEECTTFRRSLCNVVEVLEDVQHEMARGNVTGTTKLHTPMELLQSATREGGEVLKKCSSTKKLLAFAFSRQLMGMLNKARSDIEEAMRLLLVSSVRIQASTHHLMQGIGARLEQLQDQINSSYSSKHEVADLIRKELKQHERNQGHSIAQALSDALVEMGVVDDTQDCAEQLDGLQREAEMLRTAKVVYDEDLLEAVKALTAVPPPASHVKPPLATTASSAVRDCLVCPISKEVMRDPVTVDGSGITYDRKSLCRSLLSYPDLEPLTRQRFVRPVSYTPNLIARNLVMMQYGDSYYVKYDDEEFKVMYQDKWKQLRHPSGAANLDQTSSSADFAPAIIFDGLTSSAEIHSSGSGGAFFSSESGNSHAPSVAADGGSSDVGAIHTEPTIATTIHSTSHSTRCSRKMIVISVGAVIFLVALVIGIKIAQSSIARPVGAPSPAAPSAAPPSALTTQEKFKQSLPAYTMESLQDTSSPQYRAYVWATTIDQFPQSVAPSDEETRLFRMKQRFALATLFYSVNIPWWVNSSISECDWRPSGCLGNTMPRVTGLQPNGNGGRIPREIGLLESLTHLELAEDQLTSSIPTELGLLTALTALYLNTNQLTSRIPTELGLLTQLTFLTLRNNSLTSTIPTELGLLAGLNYALVLDANQLTSTIPTELGQLTALTYLYLQDNDLSGTFPSAMCQFPYVIRPLVDCDEVVCGCCDNCTR
jgi:hypothetical protein